MYDLISLLRYLPFNVYIYIIEVLRLIITIFNYFEPNFGIQLLDLLIRVHPYITFLKYKLDYIRNKGDSKRSTLPFPLQGTKIDNVKFDNELVLSIEPKLHRKYKQLFLNR